MPVGFDFKQFRYDVANPPQRLNADMDYRIVSRLPVDVLSANITLNRICDETVNFGRDERIEIKPSIAGATNAEYISLLGRSKRILTSEIGFNQKVIAFNSGTWGAASAFYTISGATLLSYFNGGGMNTIMIDEIIIHRLQSGSTKLFLETEGIQCVKLYDISGSLYATIINPMKESVLDDAKVTARLVPPVFHWKANTIRESVIHPCGDIILCSGGALGAASDVEATIKFRAC